MIPINKEVAYWKKINFDDDPPLGCIYVLLDRDEKKELIRRIDDVLSKYELENLSLEKFKSDDF